MRRNRQKVYVVINGDDINCYSNLTKAIRNTPSITYSPIYRVLLKSNKAERNGITVIKTTIQ